MKIKADLLRIKTGPYNHNGQRVEPEQQGVQRVLVTEFDAKMQGQQKTVGKIKGEIVYNTSVGEMANAMRNPCFGCRHFDPAAWRKLFVYWNDPTAPVDLRRNLNGIRAALLQTQNAEITDKSTGQDGDMDVEHALSLLGICHPLTEIHKEPVMVYPTGTCPGEVCTPTQPNGFYEPTSVEAERQGSQMFDHVMKLAQGPK